MKQFTATNTLLTKTRDDIQALLHLPKKEPGSIGLKSPGWIKNSRFHATVEGGTLKTKKQEFCKFFFDEVKMDSGKLLYRMEIKLKKYLRERDMFLVPEGFELRDDGHIIARYFFMEGRNEHCQLQLIYPVIKTEGEHEFLQIYSKIENNKETLHCRVGSALNGLIMADLEGEEFDLIKQAIQSHQTLSEAQLDLLRARAREIGQLCTEAPLSDLKRHLDPEQKLETWDPKPIRNITVTVALAAVALDELQQEGYIDDIADAKKNIETTLAEASVQQRMLGPLSVESIDMIDYYDKRTHSEKHTHLFKTLHKSSELSLAEQELVFDEKGEVTPESLSRYIRLDCEGTMSVELGS